MGCVLRGKRGRAIVNKTSISFHLNQCVSTARDSRSCRRPCKRRGLGKKLGGLGKEWGVWAKVEKVGKESMFVGKGVISLGKENLMMQPGVPHTRASLEQGTSGFSTLCINHYATWGVYFAGLAARADIPGRIERARVRQADSDGPLWPSH